MSKTPDNAHWSAAMMADVVDGAEESVGQGKRVAVFIFADKEENGVEALSMVDVALASCAFGGGCALRLPMKQFIADGVVFIHRGRRIISFCFVQCDKNKSAGRDSACSTPARNKALSVSVHSPSAARASSSVLSTEYAEKMSRHIRGAELA